MQQPCSKVNLDSSSIRMFGVLQQTIPLGFLLDLFTSAITQKVGEGEVTQVLQNPFPLETKTSWSDFD